MDVLTRYLDQNRDRFVEDLKEALRIPSVSAQPQHRDDVRRCAQHIADHVRSLGMTRVEVVPTAGHPVVYAEWRGGAGQPTAPPFRDHDVPPPHPPPLWRAPPLPPTPRDRQLV